MQGEPLSQTVLESVGQGQQAPDRWALRGVGRLEEVRIKKEKGDEVEIV